LFDQTFVDACAKTRRPWTVAVSLLLQTGLVAIAFLAPLVRVAVLERPENVSALLPPQLPGHPREPEVKPVARPERASRPVFRSIGLQAPVSIPWRIDMTPDVPEIGNAAVSTATGSSLSTLLPGTAIPPAPPPAPAARPQPLLPSVPVRITSGVQSAKLLFGPRPAYPSLARATRTQGTVKIQAVIGRDGAIKNLQVLSGPPLLIAAAMEAVQQWRYQPTLLNGDPVEVVTDIDVTFTIAR
jgi:protein TonB